ncbi:protein of unknown function [Candidatus Methylomirabilis oxygeniifera]|uniref:Uncharacterized protein n=1 Tax=Methylomirabilis oxygeniifera TaxID=671143 RepID=D5MGW9_METO1|nr:protein of unknown function [Candidatus Methylomirabilis oxyfera]
MGSTQVKLHGFQLTDLLRCEADLLPMCEEMRERMAGVFVRFTLFVALVHVATHHSHSPTASACPHSVEVRTEQYG